MPDWDALSVVTVVKKEKPVLSMGQLEQASLEKINRYVSNRLNNKYDAVIGICGPEGSGKTTQALKFAKKLDPNFTIQKNLIPFPTSEKMRDAIRNLPKRSVIIADEAMLTMYKRQSMSSNVIQMNMLLGLCRKYEKILLYIMPRFEDFDERMREHRIALWVECITRGLAAVMFPNPMRTKSGRWELDLLYKFLEETRRGKKNAEVTPMMMIRAYKRHPAYVGALTWTKMAPEEEAEYLDFVRQSEEAYNKDHKPEESNFWKDRAEKYRNWLAKGLVVLMEEAGLSLKDIHKRLGMPPSSAKYILTDTQLSNKDDDSPNAGAHAFVEDSPIV